MNDEYSYETMVEEHKRPTVFDSNILYLTVLIGMLVLGGILFTIFPPDQIGTGAFFIVLAILTIFVLGIPLLVFVIHSGIDVKFLFRLNSISFTETYLIVFLALSGYPAVIAMNIVWQWIISLIGNPVMPELPQVTTFYDFFVAIVVLAVLPSVFEELMFRGIMMRSYERLGKNAAIVFTGAMFGFLHLSFSNFPALVTLGIVIGYIVYLCNTVYAGMIYHFVHNSIAVVFLYISSVAQNYIEDANFATQMIDTDQMLLFGKIVWVIVGIVSSIVFISILSVLRSKTGSKINKDEIFAAKPDNLYAQMLPALAAGLIIILMLSIEIIAMAASR